LPRERLHAAGLALLRRGSRPAYVATLGVLTAAAAGSLLAAWAGLGKPAVGVPLAGAAGGGPAGGGPAGGGAPPAAVLGGGAGGAVTLVVLCVAVHQLLPAYARRFALRGEVRPHAELCADPRVSIACYPRRWDSVSFYLHRPDVRVYTAEQRSALIADLRRHP